MSISPLTKNQLKKVGKTAGYLALSSIIGGLLAIVTANPAAFGVATPIVNVLLVVLKQLFTTEVK